jgi:hypothetical protein
MAVVAAGSLLYAGCGGQNAEAAFATDFHCDRAVVEETNSVGRYRVKGCGREATYLCVGPYEQVCAIQTANEDRSSSEESYSPPPRPRKQIASEVRVENNGDDAVMKLELVLDDKALLRITATPDKLANVVQLKVIRQEDAEDADECNLDWMLNGQVIATPKAIAARKGDVLSHRVQVGRDLINEFGTAEKIALRICKERWALTREQVQHVRDFMDRFQEEMAWKAPPREGSTGGKLAPSGGWPAWTVPAAKPTSVEGAPLDTRALFKKLSASVFKLEATRGEGVSQGSAVAVSTTELVTNCHVVEGALKMLLRQGKQQWPARMLRADPASDRCVITADSLTAQPVAGVRSYDSLEVGEPAFTLGSPVGLELTLSNGIISGRRDEAEHHFVQTTAPISPGSSGGGLFDARGNLVGITTLVLVGREHMNQALNFAIPADAFWQP